LKKELTMPATELAGNSPQSPATTPPLPWWRFRFVWFVWGLPASVVVASLVTGGIAWTHVDPLVTDARPNHSLAAEEVAEHGQAATNALEPALAARNHAATPGK
jgi:hypothetical protein